MTTEIVTVEIIEENYPLIYKAGGLDGFYEQARAQVENEVPDLSTKKGRDRIASLAAQVSRSKKAVENPGRAYNKFLKEQPKIIDKELREFCTKMDELRDKVRQPLSEWEAEQERIKQDEEARIAAEKLAAQIEAEHEIALLLNEKFDREREEERQRIEQERIAREEEMKRQAAEQARIEAELKAKAEQERIEAEKRAAIEAEARAKYEAEQAEQRRIEAEQRAKEQAEQAERDRIEASKQAEIRAQEAARQAAEAEKRRQEAEAAEIERQRLAREADIEHRKSINWDAANALINTGLTQDQAVAVVTAIAKGEIPNITINY